VDERDYKRGEIVYIRDYPLGRPLNVFGKVVGFVGEDRYNVKMLSGLQEGAIITYSNLRLISEKESKWHFNQTK
jgi:hypothetical protein